LHEEELKSRKEVEEKQFIEISSLKSDLSDVRLQVSELKSLVEHLAKKDRDDIHSEMNAKLLEESERSKYLNGLTIGTVRVETAHLSASTSEWKNNEEEGEEENEDEDGEGTEGSGFAIKKTDKQSATKKALVIKTTGRHTIYLPVLGMVEAEDLKPGELIACNKESFIVYEKLPPEYDSRVKAMEIDERPVEEYSDIGGLDKQIEELVEAIVLPMTHKERF
jgi:26S proteasome regulatory subunit T5